MAPAGLHPATAMSPRAPDPLRQTMGNRPGKPGPERGFQALFVNCTLKPSPDRSNTEGLMAISVF